MPKMVIICCWNEFVEFYYAHKFESKKVSFNVIKYHEKLVEFEANEIINV